MNRDEKWQIPFKGRNFSGTFNCNFLWQKDQLYVMDNHRLALWCWLRHLKPKEKVDLLHIDQHYDCLQSNHQDWAKALPDNLWGISLSDYMNCMWNGHSEQSSFFEPSPLFRFDNYLSLFLEKYGSQLSTFYLSTHRDGDKPNFNFKEFNIFESLGYLNARCSGSSPIKTIVNVDLDYFTETGFDSPFVVVSDDYFELFGSLLKKGLQNGSILCLTVALSPEFVGSWDMAETLANKLLGFMGIEFRLP